MPRPPRAPSPGRTLDLDALNVVDLPGGCRIHVRVQPSGRRDAIAGVHGGALKISVSAPPERGKANSAVERLLAETLGIAADRVAIASGHAARGKTVRVAGLSGEELLARLRGGRE